VTSAAALPLGIAAASAAGLGTNYTLGLLDNLVLDSLLKGKNPSMFIDRVKLKVTPEATLYNPHPQHPTVAHPQKPSNPRVTGD